MAQWSKSNANATISAANKVKCQQCTDGAVDMVIKPRYSKSEAIKPWHIQTVPCMQPGCHSGIVDMDEYYHSIGCISTSGRGAW